MTAYQRYAANLVESHTPADISELVAPSRLSDDTTEVTGRGRRGRPQPDADAPGLQAVHDDVMLYGTAETRHAWAEKMAEAVAEPRGDRPSTWALPLGRFIAEAEPMEVQPQLPLRSVS